MAPLQIVGEAGVTETTGAGFTVTVTFCVDVQPAEVPVTVYVVVLAGLAVTIAPLVVERPLSGLQLKVSAPVAVRLTLSPEQMVADEGVTDTTGVGFTVTVTFCVDVQPLIVPVTV